MKFVLMAAAAVVFLSGQAHAQNRRAGDTSAMPSEIEQQKRMAKEEAAAKAAMKNVPDSKEKIDPWKIGK